MKNYLTLYFKTPTNLNKNVELNDQMDERCSRNHHVVSPQDTQPFSS